ncbi:AAA family ATPase, partial [Enterococcus cecorum]|uniref:AAA family ATPase n=1 Tax=Enterococcus cecorum TaxID=44008 RepID=UPI0030C68E3A
MILVVDNYLGSINHTLLTIHLLESKNIEILGLIYNNTDSRNYSTELFEYIT